MEKVFGKVESKSRKGNSIKVGGEWYSTFSSDDLDHVNWKDEVEFLYETKGKYRNIKGKVEKVASGGGSSSSGGGSRAGGGYSNIGVEVGHAANLAIRMMDQNGAEVGSAEYYKTFTEFTVNMYKVMKTIRAKVEATGGETAPAPKVVEVEPVIEVDEDLF